MGSWNKILFHVDAIEGQICLNCLLLFFVCHLQLTNFGGFGAFDLPGKPGNRLLEIF